VTAREGEPTASAAHATIALRHPIEREVAERFEEVLRSMEGSFPSRVARDLRVVIVLCDLGERVLFRESLVRGAASTAEGVDRIWGIRREAVEALEGLSDPGPPV